MVSEVIFPRFWGVVCIEKCFRNFEIVIGSAVSEISRLARFYVNTEQDSAKRTIMKTIWYLHTCYDGDRDLLAAHKKPFLVENGASSTFALVLAP